jgi:hypothetical protein
MSYRRPHHLRSAVAGCGPEKHWPFRAGSELGRPRFSPETRTDTRMTGFSAKRNEVEG